MEGAPNHELPVYIAQASSSLCRYATRNQPVILLPGVNHSHLSNGEVREGSGDLSAVASLAEANEAAGGAIADFLIANFCPVRSDLLWSIELGLDTSCFSGVKCSLFQWPAATISQSDPGSRLVGQAIAACIL